MATFVARSMCQQSSILKSRNKRSCRADNSHPKFCISLHNLNVLSSIFECVQAEINLFKSKKCSFLFAIMKGSNRLHTLLCNIIRKSFFEPVYAQVSTQHSLSTFSFKTNLMYKYRYSIFYTSYLCLLVCRKFPNILFIVRSQIANSVRNACDTIEWTVKHIHAPHTCMLYTQLTAICLLVMLNLLL